MFAFEQIQTTLKLKTQVPCVKSLVVGVPGHWVFWKQEVLFSSERQLNLHGFTTEVENKLNIYIYIYLYIYAYMYIHSIYVWFQWFHSLVSLKWFPSKHCGLLTENSVIQALRIKGCPPQLRWLEESTVKQAIRITYRYLKIFKDIYIYIFNIYPKVICLIYTCLISQYRRTKNTKPWRRFDVANRSLELEVKWQRPTPCAV